VIQVPRSSSRLARALGSGGSEYDDDFLPGFGEPLQRFL
jgi:hypothetical protein